MIRHRWAVRRAAAVEAELRSLVRTVSTVCTLLEHGSAPAEQRAGDAAELLHRRLEAVRAVLDPD